VPLLHTFQSEQQPLAYVLPGQSPLDPQASRVESGVAPPCAPPLGALVGTRMLWDGGEHAGMEDALPIARGVKAAMLPNTLILCASKRPLAGGSLTPFPYRLGVLRVMAVCIEP
jgi:hypothetical protein